MFGDKVSARWMAVAGLIIGGSACAACLLVVVVLSTVYGGETVALRNPFAPPSPVPRVQPTTAPNNTAPTTAPDNSPGSGNNTNAQQPGDSTTSETGGSQPGSAPVTGSTSASTYLPRLSGYQTAEASSIQGAIDLIRISGGFGAQSADSDDTTFQAQSVEAVLTSVIVSRVDEFVSCYQRSGAVDARIYVSSNLATLLEGGVPPLGAVAVINQNRLRESLLECTVEAGGGLGFGAQSANQPCGDVGTFSSGGNQFTYLYAGTSTDFCTRVENYYSGVGN